MRHFTTRVFVAALVFILIHAAAIPLMSSYGTQVSTGLHEIGFWQGCYFLGVVSAFTLLFTAMILWMTPHLTAFRGFLGHILAVVLGTVAASFVFDIQASLKATNALEVLALIALFLGVDLAYLLRWVGVSKAATHDFQKSWWRATIAGVAPALGVAVFNSHYIFRMTEFEPDDMLLTLVSITSWMIITYVIHYRTEYRRAMIFSYGLGRLTAGDWSTRVPIFAGGLWAPLGRLLNEALTALQERARLLRGMTRFVARDMALQWHQPDASRGTKTTLPVLLINIRQFKAITDRLNDEQLTHLLDIYIDEMLQIFVRHNLSMHKFNGDKITVCAELGDSRSVESALQAAMAILQGLPRLNKLLGAQGLGDVNVGIGMIQGDVMVRQAGEGRYQTFIPETTMAELNAMEGHTKKLNVSFVTGEATWKLLSKESQSWLRTNNNLYIL